MNNIFFILLVPVLFFLVPGNSNSQIKPKANHAESITLYEYERYDKDGNTYMSAETPTPELRYECPICKGAMVLNKSSKNRVPIMVSCWRCAGKGYLVSNSGK
jgi:hypothetical protein